MCAEVVRQGVPDHGALHGEYSAANSGKPMSWNHHHLLCGRPETLPAKPTTSVTDVVTDRVSYYIVQKHVCQGSRPTTIGSLSPHLSKKNTEYHFERQSNKWNWNGKQQKDALAADRKRLVTYNATRKRETSTREPKKNRGLPRSTWRDTMWRNTELVDIRLSQGTSQGRMLMC